MIRCERLEFAYPDGTRALDGIDLVIEAGESVAIVGRNGSGKSTLVRHWNGLLRPTSGRVLVDGRPIDDRRVAELARTVGMTFQSPDRQLFEPTCGREVAFGAKHVGLHGRELEVAVDSALEAVGLRDRTDRNPSDLGGSKRRLLAIASVLAMSTPVVVLDEPTVGLDTGEVALVEAAITALARTRRTVIVVSHDADFVARSCQRVVRLDAGRIVGDGPPATVLGG